MDKQRMGLWLFALMVVMVIGGGFGGYVLAMGEGGEVVGSGVKKISNETGHVDLGSGLGRLGSHVVEIEGISGEKKHSKKRCLIIQGRRVKKVRDGNSLIVGFSRLKKLSERSTLPTRRGVEKSSRELSERSILSIGSDVENISTTLSIGSDGEKRSRKLSERRALSIESDVEKRGSESSRKLSERSTLSIGSTHVEKRGSESSRKLSERSTLAIGSHVENSYRERSTGSIGIGVEEKISNKSALSKGSGVERVRHGSSVVVEKKEKVTYEAAVYPGEGQFLTILSIGTPPVSFTAIVDTGSDLVWRQCKPCKQCYAEKKNSFPIFDPALSSTYSKAPCTDPLCIQLGTYGGTCAHRTCQYTSPYDDPPAYTRGDLAFDTLSISDMSGLQRTVPRFAFGCSHESRGPYNFAGSGGIVGLGQGKLALPAQLGVKKFSYCLRRLTVWSIPSLLQDDVSSPSPFLQRSTEVSAPPPSLQMSASLQSSPLLQVSKEVTSSSPLLQVISPSPSPSPASLGSPLLLGDDASLGGGPDIQSTRILASEDPEDTAYNVQLRGISVAGRRLNISRSVFRRGGTIIDSGTTFTTLATQAFHAVYTAFRALIPLTPSTAASPRNLSLCYTSLPSSLPSLSFHFQGAHLHLPPHNYFVFIDNLFCLAILQSHDSRSVYGNVQQQDFHILYDLHSRLISFKPTSCSLYHR